MGIHACSTREQGQPAGGEGDDAAPCSETVTRQDAHHASNDSSSVQSSASALLASLWSPLGLLLSTSNSTDARVNDCGADEAVPSIEHSECDMQKPKDLKVKPLEPVGPLDSNRETYEKHGRLTPDEPGLSSPPEAYFAPNDVPAFKTLQKKRLTGTRTKQLLRAASRAHDDPPPEPELGLCCGSSCDPCVNDLWREERSVWRERWGDRGVEGKNGGNKKNL